MQLPDSVNSLATILLAQKIKHGRRHHLCRHRSIFVCVCCHPKYSQKDNEPVVRKIRSIDVYACINVGLLTCRLGFTCAHSTCQFLSLDKN